MSDVPMSPDPPAGGDRPEDTTLDRRRLLAGGAIVAGAVWAAPVVIDSLATPAGAVTTMFPWQKTDYGTATVEVPRNW